VLTLPLGYWAVTRLSVNADLEAMFSQLQPQRILRQEMYNSFPFLRDPMIVVVDGPSQSVVRELARDLAEELDGRNDLFMDVFLPDSHPFFRRNSLLYLTPDELDEMGDQLATIQPILVEISADPSLRGFFNLFQLSLEKGEELGVDPKDLDTTMGKLADALESSMSSAPTPFPWDEALAGKSLSKLERRQVLFVQPIADYTAAQPMAGAIEFLRERALQLKEESPQYNIRLTGEMVLVHDDVGAIGKQAWRVAILSLVLVSSVLFFAMRSWRLNIVILVTMLLCLIQTAGYAGIWIGSLNIISSTFPVLIIGLSVDFGLHFCMGYQDQINLILPNDEALRNVANHIGSSLVLCAFTTSISFLAFQVTDFRGVSELGMICGVGMILALIGGLTVIPALLTLWPGELKPRPAKSLNPVLVWLSGFPSRARRPLTAAGILLAVIASFSLPYLLFNSNPIDVRDPTTESADLFAELLTEKSEVLLSMYFLVNNQEEADVSIEALEKLNVVGKAFSIYNFVPTQQEEKLEILRDISEFLPNPPQKERPSSAQDVTAIQNFAAFLNTRSSEGGAARGEGEAALSRRLNVVTGALERDAAHGQLLQTMRENLIEPLEIGIADLRELLGAQEVSYEDLPEGLLNRFVGLNGELRIVVTPAYPLDSDAPRRRFYNDVREIAPDVMGVGPETLETGAMVASSLRDALIAAVIVMVIFLTALWQRMGDMACVLFPLLLGGLLTCATMVLAGMTFNYANVIGVPLMLGIGIDTGIHLVHRSRVEGAHGEALLRTGTTRAVIYSNLTTMASFGSLCASTHLGMASMGKTLFIAILFILLANLVILPALLEGGLRREPYPE